MPKMPASSSPPPNPPTPSSPATHAPSSPCKPSSSTKFTCWTTPHAATTRAACCHALSAFAPTPNQTRRHYNASPFPPPLPIPRASPAVICNRASSSTSPAGAPSGRKFALCMGWTNWRRRWVGGPTSNPCYFATRETRWRRRRPIYAGICHTMPRFLFIMATWMPA